MTIFVSALFVFNDLKKKGLSRDNHNQLLTLKSNTMKNTVQRYDIWNWLTKYFCIYFDI